jgi:D-sedoheptulose 7-phosphate isomerase
MNKIQNIFSESETPAQYVKSYLNYLSEVFEKIDVQKVAEFIEHLQDAREKGSTVYFIGNGGSAATASHFANDLAIGTRCPEKPFKVVSLTDNNAVMTAIANDFGYDNLFVSQLEVLLKPEDTVVAISASGNSPNIVKALEYCKKIGSKTVGISGFDGGKL